ncbi:MAG: type II toxin-antitoxin system VapC family toxin [Thermodesulfovibrionales bacterium]|nr:type II toxin-antitoxin system VapC family toxin [Thermodesulfovibrionales bacterium]
MQAVLVDTDIAIDYLRGIQYANDFMDGLWENNAACLSILSVYELYAGMREDEREDTENFINACNIETVTREIASKGGELYRQNRTKGVTLTSIDCLVAATAMVNGHKIATRNVSHYPDKKLLKIP